MPFRRELPDMIVESYSLLALRVRTYMKTIVCDLLICHDWSASVFWERCLDQIMTQVLMSHTHILKLAWGVGCSDLFTKHETLKLLEASWHVNSTLL